jgi:hypothetical protein
MPTRAATTLSDQLRLHSQSAFYANHHGAAAVMSQAAKRLDHLEKIAAAFADVTPTELLRWPELQTACRRAHSHLALKP